jgi:Fe-S-cluster containining protein
MQIKISYKSLIQQFHPCDKEFIEKVCHASCCESHTGKRNTFITILPEEEESIKKIGGTIINGILQTGDKCTFKTKEDLCSIHTTKPFGCAISPFILTPKDTLIIRNRYRLLRCYRAKEGKIPAYTAFMHSLIVLFGEEETKRIIAHIEKEKSDLTAEMKDDAYRNLKENAKIKKDDKTRIHQPANSEIKKENV